MSDYFHYVWKEIFFQTFLQHRPKHVRELLDRCFQCYVGDSVRARDFFSFNLFCNFYEFLVGDLRILVVTLRIILEQVNEFQESLYLVFIDYEKAFDRLNHENMWDALRRKGVPEKIVGLIEAQYEAFTCRVLHNGVLSNPTSPLMFIIVTDEILVGAIDREPNRGLLWQPITIEHLNNFELADDVALLTQRRSDMQSKLDDLSERSLAAGLKINVNKTKSLDVNTSIPSSFTVAGQTVEKVESLQYLGSQIAPDGGTKIDISAWIKRAALASLRNIWMNTKFRILNSNMKSVLLYTSETWCVSAENTQRMLQQVLINRCLRYIIRAWWPHNWISNAVLHRRCHQKPIVERSRRNFDLLTTTGQGDSGQSPRNLSRRPFAPLGVHRIKSK